MVAADVLDEENMAHWLRVFKRYAKAPSLWGLHNYKDANRFRTIGTKTLLRTVRGQIWLTETGGISAFTTSKGKVALPFDEGRAARSMRFLFDRLVRLAPRRITRAYIFNWRGRTTETFDSALLRPDGTVRPVYWVVEQESRRPAAPGPPRSQVVEPARAGRVKRPPRRADSRRAMARTTQRLGPGEALALLGAGVLFADLFQPWYEFKLPAGALENLGTGAGPSPT